MTHVVQNLADTVNARGVKLSYGDPVSVEGTEILPVSIVTYGFGGGGESDSPNSGGGGGGMSIPVGAYVPMEDGVRFEPNLITLLVVSIPVIWATGRAIARIIRAF